MKVFSGTANVPLYKNVIGCLGDRSRGSVSVDKFLDGEICVQYQENIRGKDVFLMQAMSEPVNDNLMELLIMIDAAKRASAKRVTAVIPFFAYARQDRKDKPRVPITAKMVANLLVAAGVDRILTMDLHSQQIQGFFDIPVDHLEAFPVFYHNFMYEWRSWGENRIKDEVVILSPDSGSAKKAVKYAEAFGAGFAICSKQRNNGHSTDTIGMVGNVEDKLVIIMDDLSTTGGTLCGAAELAVKNGAKHVVSGITHNVTTEDGLKRISESPIEHLYTTDTVKLRHNYPWIHTISVAKLFSDAIACIHENDSVSSLFHV